MRVPVSWLREFVKLGPQVTDAQIQEAFVSLGFEVESVIIHGSVTGELLTGEVVEIKHLDQLGANQKVMLKLTIPTKVNLYEDLTRHPKIIRVVALSGGYTRADANRELAKHRGLIASFSRALTEGLSINQSEAEFDKALDDSIESIYQTSTNKM